jgi:hypothetical protein
MVASVAGMDHFGYQQAAPTRRAQHSSQAIREFSVFSFQFSAPAEAKAQAG